MGLQILRDIHPEALAKDVLRRVMQTPDRRLS